MNYIIEPSCQISGLERIYADVFGNRIGIFVEVGAYDGKTYSNTYGLAEMGWTGLYIEPVPSHFDRCVGNHKDHSNVTVVMALVSDRAEKMRMYVRDDMCTVNVSFAHMLGMHEDNTGMIEMTSCTLDEMLILYNIPEYFDLLVIDVEGHELEVLAGLCMKRYMPRMMIIETHELSKNPILNANSANICRHVERFGYDKIYADSINTIFVRQV